MLRLLNSSLSKFILPRFSFCRSKNSQNQKKMQLKLKKIQQEKQQIKELNERINRTSGSFNSMTSYFWLYRKHAILFFIVFGVFFIEYKLYKISGMTEDMQTPKKFRWDMISVDYENKQSQQIEKVMKNQFKDKQTNLNSKKFSKLSKKYELIDFIIVENNQFVVLALPGRKILLSTAILSHFSENQISKLISLHSLLFAMRYHIRELSLLEILTFLFPDSIQSEIKLKKIYSRPYSMKQLLSCLQFIEKNERIKKEEIKEILKKMLEFKSTSSFSVPNRINISQLLQE